MYKLMNVEGAAVCKGIIAVHALEWRHSGMLREVSLDCIGLSTVVTLEWFLRRFHL